MTACYTPGQKFNILNQIHVSFGWHVSFIEFDFVYDMCIYLCLPPRLLIISGMIWTPHDWLNKFYNFYMAAVVSSLVGMAFALIYVSQKLAYIIRVSQHYTSCYCNFNTQLKQFHISTCMETFKRRAVLKGLQMNTFRL